MNIPDEALKAAAEAIQFIDRSNLNRTARAALEAAMPAIREAIAQEIETTGNPGWTGHNDYWDGMNDAARIVRGGTP